MTATEFELEVSEDPALWVNFDLNGTGKLVFDCSVRLYGWALKNVSSSTLASLDIYDGTDTSGVPVFPVNLASNETSREWWNRGVLMRNGVYVNVTAQEVKGALFFRYHPPR